MIQKQVIYDCETGQTRIEEINVDDTVDTIIEYPLQEPTLEERLASVEEVILNLL
ncbi:MAG: hypothetical protein E6356_17270 [Terrisporobacter othiniensis]|nr:hypothetical protein [Terrisporobacter othiniensis]